MTAEDIKAKQWSLLCAIYSEKNTESLAANKSYQENLAQAKELGLDAVMHCSELDPDMFEVFSNVWKGEYGIRPRQHITLPEVKQYLDARRFTTQETP